MIGNQETVAVAMHVETADGEFAAKPSGDEMAGPDFDQPAAFDQTIQSGFKLGARCDLRSNFAHQLLERGAGMRKPLDVLQNLRIRHEGLTNPSGVMGRERRRVPVA